MSWRASIVACLLVQVAAAAPIRLGPTGEQLSNSDVADINKLVDGPDRPWVLVGQSPGFISGRFVDVFLSPDVRTPSLRRGRIMTVKAPPLSAAEISGGWERSGADQTYAQVPMSQTDPDRVMSSRALNRPFRVFGTFTDEEIISLVAFIRSSPRGPANPARPSGTLAMPSAEVQGEWPIGLLSRSGGQIRVSLIDNSPRERSGQAVVVRRDGTTWIVQRLDMWIAD